MTTLTVREAVSYSAQLQLPDSMSTSEKKERAEITIREMGLQGSADTRIGGWSVKGISGGQKRRVSICIEILTQPKLLFLDEPTSGLDSAASYHVMNHIVKLARQEGRTIVASIHQPSSEVFELFHNLCLLSSGRTVYFGPVSMAEQVLSSLLSYQFLSSSIWILKTSLNFVDMIHLYWAVDELSKSSFFLLQFFSSNGFPCAPLRNPSDHYLRTINADFDMVNIFSRQTLSLERWLPVLWRLITYLTRTLNKGMVAAQRKPSIFLSSPTNHQRFSCKFASE